MLLRPFVVYHNSKNIPWPLYTKNRNISDNLDNCLPIFHESKACCMSNCFIGVKKSIQKSMTSLPTVPTLL